MPFKTEEQLDVQAMHRVRDRLVQRRTALINEIRGFLLERGMNLPRNGVRGALNCAESADGSMATVANSAEKIS